MENKAGLGLLLKVLKTQVQENYMDRGSTLLTSERSDEL